MDDIKVTLRLDKEQVIDIIEDWLKRNHDYILTDNERSGVNFALKTAGMQHDPYQVFSHISMNLQLGFNNFKR